MGICTTDILRQVCSHMKKQENKFVLASLSLSQTRGDCLLKNVYLEVWATQQTEETLRK